MARLKDLFARIKDTPAAKAAEIQMDLALMLESAMDMKNMTKADLAGELNCSRSYVTQALRGDKNFSILSLTKMATALDCEVKIALMPKAIYDEMFKRLSAVIKKQEAERAKAVQAEMEQVRNKPAKVIDLNQIRAECDDSETIYIAA
ncbi:helix-turn-helix domain-containing protein [Microbulbifer sp. ARAS458-1]|uniref:helix-turn-helix domain-containing protein n=1 Tax=Microbulbifer sp. ARAS458-1 TaxID=3140242 RepID=UPI00387805BC